MSGKLKLSGGLVVGKFSADPSSVEEGFIYFNTSSGLFRMYENGSFRDISAEALEAHLDGGVNKHDASELDFENTAASAKNLSAGSVEAALTSLDDAIGDLSFVPSNYSDPASDIVADHLQNIDSALASAGGTSFSDSDFRIQDNGDSSKEIAFEASGITTSTTRTITMPDSNVDLGQIATNQSNLSSHLDGGVNKHDASELDFEDTAASGKNVSAGSVESVITSLDDAIGDLSFVVSNYADPASDIVADHLSNIDSEFESKVDGPASATDNAIARFDLATGKLIQNSGVTIDDSDNVSGVNDLTISGDFTVNGTTTTVDTTNLDVQDANITINNGGSDATSEGAGLTVERTGTDGSLVYEDALASKFKLGALGSEVEVADVSSSQTFSNKSIDASSNSISNISNSEIASGAAIDAAKIHNGSVSNTEFGYIGGLTSDAQTQLNAKLENVVEDTTPQLGGNLDTNGNAVLHDGDGLKRGNSASPSNLVEEEYIDSISLSASQSGTVISDLTFAHASFEGMEIVYKIKEATSGDVRIGTIRCVTNGTDVVLNDVSTETADTGISFEAQVNGANIEIVYDSGSNAATMRADVKRIRA